MSSQIYRPDHFNIFCGILKQRYFYRTFTETRYLHMKLMIASDIHGSAFYCRQLIDAYKQEQPDKLLLLGDLLYHGPRNDLPKDYAPKQVIEMLNAISDQLICVRGNCEAEVDQMVLNFPVLSESCILYIDGQTIYATHGHINSPANPPKLHKGDILLTGHTHIPAWEEYDNFIYLNPGSVSIPKEGSEHGYMIYEDKTFLWKTLEGDVYHTL